jgi:proteasome lid subunit RPN8/RPN11
VAQVAGVFIEGTPFGLLDAALTAVILGAFAITLMSRADSATGKRRAEDGAVPHDRPGAAVLSAEHLAAVYRHAIAAYPEEACGFVRRGGTRPCRNVADELSRRRPAEFSRTTESGYALGPRDLLHLNESLDGDDPIRIIYHSHPDVGAYFSEEDARNAVVDGQAVYPVDHLVVDVTADGVRGSRLFRFSARAGAYVEVKVFGSPMPRVAARQPVEAIE